MTKNSDKNINRLKNYNALQFKKTQDMLSGKNNFFYVSLVLISVVTIIVAWLIESNTYGVDTKVFDGFNARFVLLILPTMILIALLNIVGDYFVICRRLKVRKFFSVVFASLTQSYYNFFQIWDRNGNRVGGEYLKVNGVDAEFSKNMTASKTILSKVSFVIYSIIMVILGSIFAFRTVNVFLYVLGVASLIVLLTIVLSILYFERFKDKYLVFVGKLCKFLYKLKLIKDYESLYNNLVSKFMYYGTAIKFDKLYVVMQIVFGCITKFLKHLTLFFILCSFNVGSGEIFIEVLFKCVILDLIIDILPIPNGVLLYELLFLTLFRETFISGYVLYGLVGYRFVTYLSIVITFAIGYFVGIGKKLKEIKLIKY